MKIKKAENYTCSACGQTFDKDNIVLKRKDAPLCEKCYEKTIEKSIEEDQTARNAILKDFENIRLRFMSEGAFTEEVNKCLVLCGEAVRKELG